MINRFVLTINVRGDGLSEKPGALGLDAELFLFILLGVLNFVLEYLIRHYINPTYGDAAVQVSHVFIFFLYPSFILLSSARKVVTFLTTVSLITIPLYLFILQSHDRFYLSTLFLANWIIYLIFFSGQKGRLRGLVSMLKGKAVLWGLSCALVFSFHILLVYSLAGNTLPLQIDWSWVYTNFFLELGFSLVGMEFLFRYFLFLRPVEKGSLSFTTAYLASTLLFGLPFFTNPLFNSNPAMTAGALYYIFMQGFLACFLTRYTRSIVPAFIFSLVISVLISIIFGR